MQLVREMALAGRKRASDQERERVQRLTRRLEGLLRETRGSEFMTEAQRAELFSITGKLGPIFDKYGTRTQP